MTWIVREATESDIAFLREMLFEAANWRGDSDIEPAALLSDPHIALYTVDWGRPGDTAFVGLDDEGRLAGAAWFRYYSRQDPGFGFVNETIPELSIGVRRDLRGEGLGTALMRAAIAAAAELGVPALSLSVEKENRARQLYERLGFTTVEEEDETLTMRLDLGP